MSIVVSILRGLANNRFILTVQVYIPDSHMFKEGTYDLANVFSFLADMLEK